MSRRLDIVKFALFLFLFGFQILFSVLSINSTFDVADLSTTVQLQQTPLNTGKMALICGKPNLIYYLETVPRANWNREISSLLKYFI